MAVLPSPQSTHKFYQADGVTPAASYEVYTYAAGTTTPLATYSDAAGVSANTNPIILNANGEASIYLTEGVSYDFVLRYPGGGAQVGATQRVIVFGANSFDAISAENDYGVVADGVTDDTAALENAINAASGKSLYLPFGTAASPRIIKVTRPLVISSGISPRIIGGGADKTVIRLTAATLAADVIGFVGTPRGVVVRGVKFDQNGVTCSSTCGMLAFQNAENVEISDNEFVGWDRYGLGFNGVRYFNVTRNIIRRTSSSPNYNQAFLLSSSSRPASDGRFTHNVCVNSGVSIDGSNIEIANNNISGHAFGAGVVTEQSANSNRVTIRENDISSGATALDTNGYRPGGVENWAPYSTIIGNRLWNNGGAGMDQGGGYCFVANNVCYNNGKGGTPGVSSTGDGIVSRYGDATYNANYSTYVGNTCFDSQGSKTQGYGYTDQSASLTGITLRGNKNGAHLTGTENILASVVDYDSPVIERTYTTDPISLASGNQAGYAQTFAGAAVGDFVLVSFSNPLQGINLFGCVTAANSVTYWFDNNAAGTVDLASGTVRVRVIKRQGYAAII